MAEKFGPLLRKFRKLSDLTQEGLVKEFRIALEQESYSKSDISKWERGSKIPPEDLVNTLEEILSIPKGLLLKATGYTSAAEYRRIQAGEELEKVDTEKEPFLRWQQIEHIKSLQELAKSVIESIPELIDIDDLENLESVRISLWQTFEKLTGDSRWPSLASHLGESAKELESMTFQIEPPLIPPWKKGPPEKRELSIDPYKELVGKAWGLISSSDLWLVARSGNTIEWEYNGLNQRCPYCQILKTD